MASQKLILFLFAFFLIAQVVPITSGFGIPCKTDQICRELLYCIDVTSKCFQGKCICPAPPPPLPVIN
ncbi:hypothetical protein CASFOL_004018 [Castilleja foliolosa]|uniref:Late nodulin n=1 Tax=Castilleja foliolosa TaxID=1961234 RepID=A0ABD3EKT1_9LAMI